MIRQLPVFKGYTVDARLKQFRRVDPDWGMEFIEFNSEKGEILLEEYIATIDADTPEGMELLVELW